jgi:hypothetical protein
VKEFTLADGSSDMMVLKNGTDIGSRLGLRHQYCLIDPKRRGESDGEIAVRPFCCPDA